ncbi:unnamed protein product [Rotaria sp. Silwood1]|nr:unnamed protein product [Rotaria sp. Silwood1]CAF1599790.1 unnamed protein product [Rotaria sp. Silwood1]CAF3667908.1 unnamed protein product [Rotaria sp. Silwood1]CAF3688774.1 unnamed protein product [Rotaria sp. Silwood1]CAF3706121.1 unnamed protein product [Rotaria sp. Silwood1]
MSRFDTIDISALFGDDMDAKMEVAKKIDRSCRDTGFFFISNHTIDCLDELFERIQRYHLSENEDEKFKMAINAYNKNNTNILTGYYMSIKGVKAVESLYVQNPSFNADHVLIKAKTPLHEITQWPDETKHPGFKKFITEYYWKMFCMCKILLHGFALALGKNENFFDNFYNPEDTISSLRLIRYPYIENYPPVITAPDGQKLNFDTHTDVSLLTVLYQPYVANLQVETPDGYIDIESSSDTFLVNCGLYMEKITNNYYKSPWHRVKFVNKERLSIPFFVHLGYNSVIESFTPYDNRKDIELNDKWNKSYGEFFSTERVNLIKKNGQT